jgi:formate dehydrogenase subunit gamma
VRNGQGIVGFQGNFPTLFGAGKPLEQPLGAMQSRDWLEKLVAGLLPVSCRSLAGLAASTFFTFWVRMASKSKQRTKPMKTQDNTAMSEEDVTQINAACAHYNNDPAALIEILHDVQAALGFLPENALTQIGACLNITRAEVHGVASFYDDFRTHMHAGTMVRICKGEACQSMGAGKLETALRNRTQSTGEMADLEMEPVFCLGNCALAPAATINGKLYGKLDHERLVQLIEEAGK